MRYTRLTLEEREEIHALIHQGMTKRAIADKLDRSHSTIVRELKRCKDGEYSPSKAHKHARRQDPSRGRKSTFELTPEVIMEAMMLLSKNLSPEQISQTMKREHANEPLRWISHESIYKYIYAFPRGELRKAFTTHLRRKRRQRQSRSNAHKRRGQIPDAIPISQRPAEVDDRAVPGHWEGDLIIGKNHKSALGTLVERTSRLVLLVPLEGKDAKTVRESFADIFSDVEDSMKKSMTYDRGLEMAEHKAFTEDTGIPVYFADPYCPWQRGTNENTNGLIRQYFPKGTDFRKISLERIKFVQNELNERIRKVLGWKSPKEVFKELVGALDD